MSRPALAWVSVYVPWVLEATLWSAALLLFLRATRRWSPHCRAAVVSLGTVKLLLPPVLLSRLGMSRLGIENPLQVTLPSIPGEPALAPAWASSASDGSTLAGFAPVVVALVAVAALGSSRILFACGLEVWRLSRLRRDALRIGRLGRIEILASDAAPAPFAMGLTKPAVVMPTRLSRTLGSEQRDLLIAHEVAHIRAGDIVWTWIGTLAYALFWFHPWVRLLVRGGRIERELRADDRVIASGRASGTVYARTVLAAAEVGMSPALEQVVPAAAGPELETRLVRMTSRIERRRRLGAWRTAVLLVALVPSGATAVFTAGEHDAEAEVEAVEAVSRALDGDGIDGRSTHERSHRQRHQLRHQLRHGRQHDGSHVDHWH